MDRYAFASWKSSDLSTEVPSLCAGTGGARDPALRKTSEWKRNLRSVNSPWQPYGAKKRARTQRWAATQKLKFFRQVLYDNNISLKDMHDILVWYFKQEARYDAVEDSAWPLTGEHNATRQPPLYSVANPETSNKGAPR